MIARAGRRRCRQQIRRRQREPAAAVSPAAACVRRFGVRPARTRSCGAWTRSTNPFGRTVVCG